MADILYNNFKKHISLGNIDLVNDTIKIALVTSSYTPNADTHEFFSDVTNEITGTGYTAGGKALSGKMVTIDTTNDRSVFDADDIQWDTASFTARGAVVYKDTGVTTTSPLVLYLDFVIDKTAASSDFAIRFDALGIWRF